MFAAQPNALCRRTLYHNSERKQMNTIFVVGNQVANCISLAKRHLNLGLARNSRPLVSGEFGNYRATFPNGDVAEITIRKHAKCRVMTEDEAQDDFNGSLSSHIDPADLK
jgi:hypothetical protein